MVPLLGVLLFQSAVADRIHAEDAQAFEAALLGYWAQDRSESKTIYLPDVTEARGWITDEDAAGKRIPLDPAMRKSFEVRNASPTPLSWFKPRSRKLQIVPKDDPKKHSRWNRPRSLPWEPRQYCWMSMPGYSPGRDRALVCFGFNWSIHSGRASVWLTKSLGVWKVAHIGSVHFL